MSTRKYRYTEVVAFEVVVEAESLEKAREIGSEVIEDCFDRFYETKNMQRVCDEHKGFLRMDLATEYHRTEEEIE